MPLHRKTGDISPVFCLQRIRKERSFPMKSIRSRCLAAASWPPNYENRQSAFVICFITPNPIFPLVQAFPNLRFRWFLLSGSQSFYTIFLQTLARLPSIKRHENTFFGGKNPKRPLINGFRHPTLSILVLKRNTAVVPQNHRYALSQYSQTHFRHTLK